MDPLILILITPIIFLVLYSLTKVLYSLWWKPKWLEKKLKQQGIKGTSYTFLTGDMKEWVKQVEDAWSKPANLNHQIAARVDPFTHSISQKYGKVSMCWAGSTPRLIIKDAEMMKQVLSNKEGHFEKPYIDPQLLVLTRGLTTLEGEKWTKHRRIINPAFHIERLKNMVPDMAAACGEFIEKWKNLAGAEGSCEVDIWPEFQNLTADVISRTAFGSNYAEGRHIFELHKELLNLVIEAMQTLYIPGLRYIPTKKNRRRKELSKMITSMLTDVIRKKESAVKAGESKADDLLGLLLQSNQHSNEAENATTLKYGGLTVEEVIEECKQFYLAGQETTASLLNWATIILAMHPDWQEKARKEVIGVCGKNSIDFEATTYLRTVNMILLEVLRLYSPVIAQYQHTYKETKLGDFFIPAGVDVTLPTLLIHHDLDIWGDDVDEFNPERFSEGVSKASKDQLAFFPFGFGAKTCVGQNFALVEAKVALSMILQNFSFQLSPSYSHAPHTVMMLQPQHGAHIIMYPLTMLNSSKTLNIKQAATLL
ncbi:cytochrome P450 CYP72A219-like isoform X1 [Chenopodium quinoa]|uniref:cytochrome P450 CYP72A219-like isoform X1 n=1 Tax=Chenopodium quinoa TaxID=63459 RepID=UPI000B77D184|nr:cytochrome P450 CYP72A219-like isoform X1 [Chenopodium quinoa]